MNTQNKFHLITETPGTKASKEQLKRALQRYHLAFEMAKDKDVLEVACGTGIGLGYLNETAASVTGCDIDETNLSIAKENYKNTNITILHQDAEKMSFPDESFDLVLLFEAIYYLPNPASFAKEAHRILKPGGKLIICTVNKDWEDFHPSPYVTRYFSVPELHSLLVKEFHQTEFFGGFPVGNQKGLTSRIKKLALKFNIIPGSLKARAYLKRIFMGKLVDLPKTLTKDISDYEAPVSIDHTMKNENYVIIYAVGEKSSV